MIIKYKLYNNMFLNKNYEDRHNIKWQKEIFKQKEEVNYCKVIFNLSNGNIRMEDKTLICKDCGREFVFTVGEQEFYKEKGFENEPVRCPDCRRARKQQNNRR